MKNFPYPLNFIPITFSIIQEIENLINNNIKTKEIYLDLNLPIDYKEQIEYNKQKSNNQKYSIYSLIDKHLVTKLQKLYPQIELDFSIIKDGNYYLLKLTIKNKNVV